MQAIAYDVLKPRAIPMFTFFKDGENVYKVYGANPNMIGAALKHLADM